MTFLKVPWEIKITKWMWVITQLSLCFPLLIFFLSDLRNKRKRWCFEAFMKSPCFFPGTSKQRGSEETNKNILVFWVQSNAHSRGTYFFAHVQMWTHCHLEMLSPGDQLSVTQSLVWFSTALWPCLSFLRKLLLRCEGVHDVQGKKSNHRQH